MAKGTAYHYFIVKIMDEQAYDVARSEALAEGNVPRGYLQPQRTGIIPRNPKTSKSRDGRALDISIGYRMSASQARKAGLMVQVKDFATGYSRQQVERWLKSPVGRKWAGDSLCVVFYSAVDDVTR